MWAARGTASRVQSHGCALLAGYRAARVQAQGYRAMGYTLAMAVSGVRGSKGTVCRVLGHRVHAGKWQLAGHGAARVQDQGCRAVGTHWQLAGIWVQGYRACHIRLRGTERWGTRWQWQLAGYGAPRVQPVGYRAMGYTLAMVAIGVQSCQSTASRVQGQGCMQAMPASGVRGCQGTACRVQGHVVHAGSGSYPGYRAARVQLQGYRAVGYTLVTGYSRKGTGPWGYRAMGTRWHLPLAGFGAARVQGQGYTLAMAASGVWGCHGTNRAGTGPGVKH